ncbi:hypothetical protein LLG90_00010 [Aromatoleum toluclasticum]|uniref:hypothetical protein n=1 Tax=Aromatoleum toluclasticum TaxID=92003 RepID=UPI001D191D9E|nr:hypothetical protein [Aromatoleum toluclasticum]MCC4113727.1 hypothetical protein [Aromatoleum toluclasticum]
MTIDTYVTGVYWMVAFIASALYGWHAVNIFKSHVGEREQQPHNAWCWHQRWSYFLGALVGWLALWLLIRKFGGCVFGDCAADVGVLDVVGAFVAFVGVTGHLKDTVVSLVSGIGGLAGKLAEVLSAWVARR